MFKYLLAIAACILAAPTWAEYGGHFSANMGTATKYMHRGLKQSDADIVFHGGVDYTGPMGVYGGVWGYTGSIEDLDTTEVNAYAGAAYSFNSVSLGFGVIHYERGADHKSATRNAEYNINVSWDAYRLSSYQDEASKDQYHELAANYALWGDAGLAISAGLAQPDGSQDEDRHYAIGFVKAMPSNVDFEVTLSRHDGKGNSLILGLSRQFAF
ncbi:MAG: TorF family putative porin [Bermanella sp.]